MSPIDPSLRPSLPHALRRPTTDRGRALAPATDDAETVREAAAASDAEIAELLAILRDPSGFSVESVLKLLQLSQRRATAVTRQADKLGVDLGVGRLSEKLDSMIASTSFMSRLKSRVLIGAAFGGWTVAVVLGIWNLVAPKAREAAEVAVIAPAIEAKRVAEVAADKTDEHTARLDAIEASQSQLAASVEKLNGAVIALTSRLPDPPPVVVDVPRARKKKGLDE